MSYLFGPSQSNYRSRGGMPLSRSPSDPYSPAARTSPSFHRRSALDGGMGMRSESDSGHSAFRDSWSELDPFRDTIKSEPQNKTVIRLSYRQNGSGGEKRYYAGVFGGVHVFTGRDIDELARSMVSPDGRCSQSLFPAMYSKEPGDVVIVSGRTKVRTGRGMKYIQGTRSVEDFETDALSMVLEIETDKALTDKAHKLRVAEEEARRMDEATREQREAQAERDRQQAEARAREQEQSRATVRHHGWNESSILRPRYDY